MFNKKIDKKYFIRLITAGVVFLALASLSMVFSIANNAGDLFLNSYERNTISVNGTAEVSVTPDIATISFSATKEEETAGEAQEEVSKIVEEALDVLYNAGVEEKDIKTSINIYPRYDYLDSGRELTGYEVSQNISVKIRNIEKIGELITEVVDTKVTNFNGPHFSVENEEDSKEEARRQAIQNAKENADKLAKELGVKLGKLVNYYENSGDYYYPYYQEDFAMETSTKSISSNGEFVVPLGDEDLSVDVTLVYKVR